MKICLANILAILGTLVLTLSCQALEDKASIASACEYPRVVSAAKNTDSAIALRVATLAFKSKSINIYDAGDYIQKDDKAIVLWPADDGSIKSNPQFIESKEFSSDKIKKLCLQLEPDRGTRYAVRQTPGNYRGDRFDLLLVKSTAKPDKLMSTVEKFDQYQPELAKAVSVLFIDCWQQPWLLRNPDNGHMIAIDTQHPATFYADWNVYEVNKLGKPVCICRIAFKPKADQAITLIPPGPLHDLAQLLDEMIGHPKADAEGTMQQTAYLRIFVNNQWGNLLYRPWAMSSPASSRQEIEQALKKWANECSANKRRYAKLQDLYPKALAQLSKYDEQVMHMTPEKAAIEAKKDLDIAYRTNFQF